MAKKPTIEVTFRQMATTMIERSERGIAALIIRDDTDETVYKEYRDAAAAAADESKYTPENMQAIRDVMASAPYKVAVVRTGAPGAAAAALKIIEEKLSACWIAFAKLEATDQTDLIAWIKAKEKETKSYNAIVYKADAPDNKQIVNFTTEKVTFADERGERSGDAYIPAMLGRIAAANIRKSITYGACTDLIGCSENEDEESAVENGELILANVGGTVRIVSGCNSLVSTNGKTLTEDMQYIETVAAMQLIVDDIRDEWRRNYLGNYRNSYDNQMLFVGAIDGYLAELERIEVLDPEYTNKANINADQQRESWLSAGHAEMAEWTDAQIIRTPFKRDVYIMVDLKILGSMENIRLLVNMF